MQIERALKTRHDKPSDSKSTGAELMGPELVERRAVKSARVGEQLDCRPPGERKKRKKRKKGGCQTTDVPTKTSKSRHRAGESNGGY